MAHEIYRPSIHAEGAAALTTALAYALANCYELSETDREYIGNFIKNINTKEAVYILATQLAPRKPVTITDEDLMRREAFSPEEVAELLHAPMELTDEQLQVREAEQQVKRLGPPSHSAAESKPDIDGNDTQNRDTD